MSGNDIQVLVDKARSQLTVGADPTLGPEDQQLLVSFVRRVSSAYAFSGDFDTADSGFELAQAAAHALAAVGVDGEYDQTERSVLNDRRICLSQGRRYPEAISVANQEKEIVLAALRAADAIPAVKLRRKVRELDAFVRDCEHWIAGAKRSPRVTDVWNGEHFAMSLKANQTWWQSELRQREIRARPRQPRQAKPPMAPERAKGVEGAWLDPATRSVRAVLDAAQQHMRGPDLHPLDKEEMHILVGFTVYVSEAFAVAGDVEQGLDGLDLAMDAARECGVEKMRLDWGNDHAFQDVEIAILAIRGRFLLQSGRLRDAVRAKEMQAALVRERAADLSRPEFEATFGKHVARLEAELEELLRLTNGPDRPAECDPRGWDEDRFLERMASAHEQWLAKIRYHAMHLANPSHVVSWSVTDVLRRAGTASNPE
jgi:hypothetical protein